nr:hypothetical protein [Tanacetum cinerariifolium]
MVFTSSSSSSFDNEVASCSKACTKAYATLQSHYDKLTNDLRKSQFDVIYYKTGLESVEARILVYQPNETIFEEDIKLLKLDVQLRDNALVDIRKKFKKAEQERDELKIKLDKFQTSSKNISQLLASQTNDKTRLGYDNQDFNSSVFACDEMFSSESDVRTFRPPKPDLVFHDTPTINENVPTAFIVEFKDESEGEPKHTQTEPSFVQPIEHVKTPRPSVKTCKHPIPAANLRRDFPKSRRLSNSRNNKACFVCKSLTHLIKDCDYYEKQMVQKHVRNHAMRGNSQHYARMTTPNPQRHVVPTAVLTRSRLVPLNAARPVNVVVPQTNVTRPRPANTVVTKTHSPPRRNINCRPSPKPSNFPKKVTTIKAPKVNAVKGVIDSGCSRYMTENMSYLSDFKEINDGYVAFGGNPKGGKITGKGKIRTEKLDFDDVYFVKELKFNFFSVSQMENSMYNVDLKNIVPLGDLTCLFAKATLDESNLWHIRLGHINFKTMNKLVKGKFDEKADERFLVGYSVSSKAFRVFNSRTRIIQETLHINFLENKPNVAGSGPTKLFDIDTITKSMNYQPVIARNQPNPSADPRNTDDDATFEVKEPEFEVEKPKSEVHVSPSSSAKTKKHDDKTTKEAKGKSLVEFSIGFQNLNITYSDDEKDVGAEADLSNLETTITVSPIPTSRVYKDHPVTQIIGDLSSATQTRSMTRMVKDQGGLTQIYNEDFHTCMFACFLSQEEPKRVHQALKDPSWIEAMQEKLLQFKMQKVWVLVDLPKGKRAIGLKWIFRNKKDERGIVIRNKAQLEKGIDYEEVFAPLARIESIRLFLAYASFMGFMVYQMDVKSVFLYGTIEEERGKIDQTLFIKKQKGDILLVQVYVDDIIFGSTNKDLLKQKPDGIFISQDKYVAEILRKFGLTDGKSASTPIDTEKPLLKDPNDSDYAGANLDMKYTTGGYQFLGCRLISWQCKKQTVVATSSTEAEAEYVAAASCCAQVLWIQNQLLDYRKKAIITEDTVREALHMDDAESIDCLPNEETYTELARMGLVRNVDSSLKFYMYPRFLQLMISAQVGDLSPHTTKYTSRALTQKAVDDVTNIVADAADDVVAEDAAEPTPPSPTPTTPPPPPPQELPSTSQVAPTPPSSPIGQPSLPPQQQQPSQPSHDAAILMDLLNILLETCTTLNRKVEALEQDKVGTAQRVESSTDTVMDDQEDASKQGDDEAEPAELKEMIEVVTTAKLMTEVVTTAATTITASTITAAPSAAKRRKGVVIRDPKETATPSTIVHFEPKSKDKGKGILVEESKPLKKKAHIKQDEAYAKEKPQTEAQARKNMMVYLKNMAGFKMDFFKGMSYDAISPIFEKNFNSVVCFLEKSEEQLEEEASRALKRKTKSSEEKAAKKQKLDEKVEELKKHLQIVPNDEDDVYTEATPLAPKMILLVERRYPLTRFTLDQVLNNVRLEVEEESEVSLELLRFVNIKFRGGLLGLNNVLIYCMLMMFSFGVDAVEDFKEYTLRDYYCWLKTYCCWYKLKLLDNAADSRLRLLEQSAAADDKMKEYH